MAATQKPFLSTYCDLGEGFRSAMIWGEYITGLIFKNYYIIINYIPIISPSVVDGLAERKFWFDKVWGAAI